MSTEPLQHLTEQSAGVGSWMLKVIEEPQEEDYTWNKSGKSGVGRKLSCVLVSEDHTQYCEGVYKKQGKEPQATQNYKQAVTKYKNGIVWKVSKVSLAKQDPKYLGCSCKVLIDMNTSTFQPVLQSTVKMPNQAAPPHDLATLLQCAKGQIVDIIALVANATEPVRQTTANGERDLVDVTIMDDSGTKGAASCKFPAWFPATPTGAPCDHLTKLNDAMASGTSIAFFNLVVQKEDEVTTGAPEHSAKKQKTTLKTCRNKLYFHICDDGARAEKLKNNATTITSTSNDQVTVVTEMPTFVPSEKTITRPQRVSLQCVACWST